jgi:hypothetical protein
MGGGVRPDFSMSGMGASIGEPMFMELLVAWLGRGAGTGAGLIDAGLGDL